MMMMMMMMMMMRMRMMMMRMMMTQLTSQVMAAPSIPTIGVNAATAGVVAAVVGEHGWQWPPPLVAFRREAQETEARSGPACDSASYEFACQPFSTFQDLVNTAEHSAGPMMSIDSSKEMHQTA
jgi:hypothetical protein